jgi:hypothetical protein
MHHHIPEDQIPGFILIKHYEQWRQQITVNWHSMPLLMGQQNKLLQTKETGRSSSKPPLFSEFFWTRTFFFWLLLFCVYGARSSVDIKTVTVRSLTVMDDARKLISCLIKSNEKDITKMEQHFACLTNWGLPYVCILCTPKNQNIYALIQTDM